MSIHSPFSHQERESIFLPLNLGLTIYDLFGYWDISLHGIVYWGCLSMELFCHHSNKLRLVWNHVQGVSGSPANLVCPVLPAEPQPHTSWANLDQKEELPGWSIELG